MANVEYKSAIYKIGPSSSEQFTFWWGQGSTRRIFRRIDRS